MSKSVSQIHSVDISKWEVATAIVTGANHRRHNKECQDAIDCSSSELALALALADGHGSEKSPKSRVGSQVAVEVALKHLMNEHLVSGTQLSLLKEYAQTHLPLEIVNDWVTAIKTHEPSRSDLSNLLTEYGSTLVAVLITEYYLLYLQLGDGDILCVSPQGVVSRPIPLDPHLLGDEVTSLCQVDKKTGQPNAWNEMTVTIQPMVTPPALILVATDGYTKSFSSRAGFEKVGADIVKMILETESWEVVKQQLSDWLEEATTKGSGDDISVGLIWNSAELSKKRKTKNRKSKDGSRSETEVKGRE